MHSEVHKFTNGKLINQLALDNDEFDLNEELSRLEAHLNDPCEDAWWVWNRCEFLGWTIKREYMPWDVYANDEGYEYCIYTDADTEDSVIVRKL